MAASADRFCDKQNIFGKKAYLMKASTTIYAGTMVMVDATTGLAEPAADTANCHVMGVACKQVTSGATGNYYIEVEYGEFLMNASSITQGGVGDKMYVVDDQTIDETSPANNVVAGVLTEYVSATKGWVLVSPYNTAI